MTIPEPSARTSTGREIFPGDIVTFNISGVTHHGTVYAVKPQGIYRISVKVPDGNAQGYRIFNIKPVEAIRTTTP